MKALRQLASNVGVLFHARRHRLDLVRALARRPQLLVGTGLYEVAIGLSARVEPRLKVLAELKVAALVACEYCLDIGSALGRDAGLAENQLRDLHTYRSSAAFDDDERLVLELAEAMTRAPAVVPEGLREQLAARLTRAGMIELVAVIAWENQRARLNQALGIRPSGFSDGAFCVLPDPLPEPV
ncbi:MAG: carboxymuconolactone decarboxylase family protein [Acidimicrobiales bacterium]